MSLDILFVDVAFTRCRQDKEVQHDGGAFLPCFPSHSHRQRPLDPATYKALGASKRSCFARSVLVREERRVGGPCHEECGRLATSNKRLPTLPFLTLSLPILNLSLHLIIFSEGHDATRLTTTSLPNDPSQRLSAGPPAPPSWCKWSLLRRHLLQTGTNKRWSRPCVIPVVLGLRLV